MYLTYLLKSLVCFLRRSLHYLLHGVPVHLVRVSIATTPKSQLLEGKSALITGGTGGIGYAITKAFLNAGASCIITGRSSARCAAACDKLRQELGEEIKIQYIESDNQTENSAKIIMAKLSETEGSRIPDILVNNAGINGCSFSDATVETYDSIMQTNLRAPFFLSLEIARAMRDAGVRGNILNITSVSSVRPANSAYCLSKWGLRGLTLGLAKTLIPYGIVVNGIAPGATATPMLIKSGTTDNLYNSGNPQGRYTTPEEVAEMALVLVSSTGRSVVGDVVYMSGGAGITTYDDVPYQL